MAIEIEYGQLYIGNILKDTYIPEEPYCESNNYLIVPLERLNKFKVIVYDFSSECKTEYHIRHFKNGNFVKV